MKKLKLLSAIFLGGLSFFSSFHAQEVDVARPLKNNAFRVSIRGGYDFPNFKKLSADQKLQPFYKYEGGFMAGASLDYYWDWFGLGLDYDYIRNQARSTYPADNLLDPYSRPFNDFYLSEEKITRNFVGIGPSFRFWQTPKSDFEFKLRAGVASIKGGEINHMATPDSLSVGTPTNPEPPDSPGDGGGETRAVNALSTPIMLNYHAGYNLTSVFTGKASLQFNYFFSPHFGMSLGGYYMQHFKTPELFNSSSGMSYGTQAPHTTFNNGLQVYDPLQEPMYKRGPIDTKFHSFGVFAGMIFQFISPVKTVEAPKPIVCSVHVTAKDEGSGSVLSNVAVSLVDSNDTVVQNATTDADGHVHFGNVVKGYYSVKGTYNGKELTGASVDTGEFNNCDATLGIVKEIVLPDQRFVVQGNVMRCNTSEPIADAEIIVTNKTTGAVENYRSDANGQFSFRAPENTDYTVYAKKANHLSQNVSFSTRGYNRSSTSTIRLEICMDLADCNNAIILKDILYDLDKSFIRDDAKPELNRLVQFLNDNPSIRVELSSHTDSRASDNYNNKLSQRRAQAAVDYIVSQGIAKDRLIAKGYGEKKLLNRCADHVKCSEAEHQMNRRTEMKVICPK
ncbi:OmpA family protein [Amniculibacterium aquaticum]|uniref:OmpA family protein n=1 Tax=Amniculibacterium aquaticum TaxID=2479858 RepID=UPI000F5B67D0|nr:OmpA family protein [Amniculibacterium aquaticum]